MRSEIVKVPPTIETSFQILRDKIAQFVLRKPATHNGLRPGKQMPEMKVRHSYRMRDSKRPKGLEGAASRGGGNLKRMRVDAAKNGHNGGAVKRALRAQAIRLSARQKAIQRLRKAAPPIKKAIRESTDIATDGLGGAGAKSNRKGWLQGWMF